MLRSLWLMGVVACTTEPVRFPGSWILSGDEISGYIRGESATGCRDGRVLIGLWGPHWGTSGVVAAEVETLEDGGAWLYFALETGVATGRAALLIQGAEARLPLGGRADEFVVRLSVEEGALSDAEAERLAVRSQESVEEEQALWAQGRFRLMESERVVGDVVFAGTDPTMVTVYDTWWLTPEPVVARRRDDGTDMVLAFPAEPSIMGEPASIRVNVPLRRAVVPIEEQPMTGDRYLELFPGAVSETERAVLISRAVEENRALEHAAVVDLVSDMARGAKMDDGSCRSPNDLLPHMEAMLSGYRVRVEAREADCLFHLEPEVEQHGRRFRGVVGPLGLVGEEQNDRTLPQ